MAKRIVVILGHPDGESLCAALADAYVVGAKAAGAEVRLLRLGELAYDPILHQGYQVIQALEPDLVAAQEQIVWAEHLVWVYPTWWGGMPALMKGFVAGIGAGLCLPLSGEFTVVGQTAGGSLGAVDSDDGCAGDILSFGGGQPW